MAQTPKLPNKPKIRSKLSRFCLQCKSDIAHKNVKNKFCSSECSILYKKHQIFSIIERDKYYHNYRQLKDYLIYKNGNVCSICGFSGEWNGSPVIMVFDHINGKSADNRLDNVRLVCPMCDSQLPTFKSKNKNSDRVKRVGQWSN